MLKTGRWWVLCMLSAWIAGAPAIHAFESDRGISVGARVGFGKTRESGEHFHLYEAVADFPLPQHYRWDSGWAIRTAISAHAGILRAGQENSLIVAVGPNFKVDLPGGRAFFTAGARAGLLSDHKLGNANLGGAFTFETDVGVIVNLIAKISAGYLWTHLSNGNIYGENPGINLHTIALTYRF